jgi:outer membrane protein
VEPQFKPLSWDLDQLVQTAYERRPDLQSLMAISNSHEFEASSERGALRPQVTASVGIQYEENRFASPNTLAIAAAVLDWNLYDGGKSNRLADAAQARAMSVRHLIEDLKSQIAVDLLAARNDVTEAAEQLDLAEQRVNHTTEQLRVTQLRFERGMVLSATVLDAQSQWAQALRDQQIARYQAALAQLRIRYLAGLL